MLDRANSGPEPSEDILRAILHGVAAGACQAAARETGSAYWAGMAQDQRKKAEMLLHHAAARFCSAADSSWASEDLARSRRATVTPETPARRRPMTLPSSNTSRER